MSDVGRRAAPAAEPRLFERELAQGMIDIPPHLLHPPRSPGPKLRQPVIEHRNVPFFCHPGDVPVEARIVNEHDGIGRVFVDRSFDLRQ